MASACRISVRKHSNAAMLYKVLKMKNVRLDSCLSGLAKIEHECSGLTLKDIFLGKTKSCIVLIGKPDKKLEQESVLRTFPQPLLILMARTEISAFSKTDNFSCQSRLINKIFKKS